MVCGVQYKSDEIKKRWDGLLVCKEDWEPRHSLDFLRATPERGSVPFSSPEPADTFVSVPYISGKQGISGIALSGMAITGYVNPLL